MSEIWKTIPGYEGLYEASNLGRIRSVDRVVTTYSARAGKRVPLSRKGKVLQQDVGPHGYNLLTLSKNGNRKTKRVNRLVCAAFNGEQPSNVLACHNDGDKRNNAADNLRWGTPAENQSDRVIHGTSLRGEAVATSKLTASDVAEILESKTYGSLINAKVSKTQYHKIKNGESWKHLTETIRGGFHDGSNDWRAA
ncbi:NUMOD4 motif-containing HNH endonuclease [Agrobacterium radiobacter]|uniref:NUMOD4 motif-containing HNH endonuclease n=1 Tax=Agrobacterium radiobacter TaxID=362 RepID=UPI003F87C524